MMHVARVAAFLVVVVALATVTISSGAVAQDNGFTCEDFLTQTAAQNHLEQYPSDPYGLDPDGNGIACEHMLANGTAEAGGAPDVDAPEEARPPLDARLGGTVESWQAEFGSPVEGEGEQADLFTEYALPDFSTVYAHDHLGRIESITLFAPRPEGEEWTDDAHAMNWSVEEARKIAGEFLPRDAQLEEMARAEGSDLDQVLCTSDALAAEVPQELYDYVDNTPQYGRCSYALLHEDGGDGDRISWIIIELEIEEPLGIESISGDAASSDESSSVEVPQGDSESTQVGFNAEERAYIDEIEGIIKPVGDGLIRVGELFLNPPLSDEDWVSEVAPQFAMWKAAYQDVLTLDPPPAFADIHRHYTEAMRLIAEATDDITGGLDTGDNARFNQAIAKFGQAQELIDQARALIDELVAERGG